MRPTAGIDSAILAHTGLCEQHSGRAGYNVGMDFEMPSLGFWATIGLSAIVYVLVMAVVLRFIEQPPAPVASKMRHATEMAISTYRVAARAAPRFLAAEGRRRRLRYFGVWAAAAFVVVVLLLPALYVASFRAACSRVRSGKMSIDAAAWIYLPLIRLANSAPAPVRARLVKYSGRPADGRSGSMLDAMTTSIYGITELPMELP